MRTNERKERMKNARSVAQKRQSVRVTMERSLVNNSRNNDVKAAIRPTNRTLKRLACDIFVASEAAAYSPASGEWNSVAFHAAYTSPYLAAGVRGRPPKNLPFAFVRM